MDLFLQQTFSGLAFGGVYASVALAVVMIYQATDHFNFAQGEMATFSTYIAFSLLSAGLGYWWAFILAVLISFVGGMLVERIIVRPVEKAPILNQVIVFIGLLVIFNSLGGWIWDFTIKSFPSPFPSAPIFGNLISTHQAGVIGVTLVVLALVAVFFRFTPVGLAMRAAAQDPDSAKLVGVRVGWKLALGWGLAAAIGAVAGVMVAPIVFLEPNMMVGVLLYGFAGALLGGVSNPIGAVIGGFIVGVLEALVGTYVPFVGNELKLSVALVLIVGVLVFKPSGLFGRVVVRRV
ncbi:MAG TPA: branched-chain amino acid ABC transporter permease [Alphaproteobacteria bacterium]|nr:branched-chain amino acid ABC transporter permease [Alphaproteobacteria bacterium]